MGLATQHKKLEKNINLLAIGSFIAVAIAVWNSLPSACVRLPANHGNLDSFIRALATSSPKSNSWLPSTAKSVPSAL